MSLFAFFSPGPVEICIVIFVAVLLIGPKMVPSIARSLGAIPHSFRRGMEDGKRELQEATQEVDVQEGRQEPQRRSQHKQEQQMKAAEFRKVFCLEMRRLNYFETWEGKGALLQGHKYPKGGGCPLPKTHWSVDLTVTGGKTAVATLRDGSQKRVVIDDPVVAAREIVAWMGITEVVGLATTDQQETSMNCPADRAQNSSREAEKALEPYLQCYRKAEVGSKTEAMIDLLVGLRHYADSYNIDIYGCWVSAGSHHQIETKTGTRFVRPRSGEEQG